MAKYVSVMKCRLRNKSMLGLYRALQHEAVVVRVAAVRGVSAISVGRGRLRVTRQGDYSLPMR